LTAAPYIEGGEDLCPRGRLNVHVITAGEMTGVQKRSKGKGLPWISNRDETGADDDLAGSKRTRGWSEKVGLQMWGAACGVLLRSSSRGTCTESRLVTGRGRRKYPAATTEKGGSFEGGKGRRKQKGGKGSLYIPPNMTRRYGNIQLGKQRNVRGKKGPLFSTRSLLPD